MSLKCKSCHYLQYYLVALIFLDSFKLGKKIKRLKLTHKSLSNVMPRPLKSSGRSEVTEFWLG